MSELTFPGQVEVTRMELHSPSTKTMTDIRYIYTGFNIYEDIFAPFISGAIVIQDALGLLNKLPIIGEELLELEVITPGLEDKPEHKIKGKFYIYKITDREKLTNKMVSYTLHFVSIEAIIDMNIKLSKGFNGKISDTVLEILKKYSFFANGGTEPTAEQISRFNIEETDEKYGHAHVSNFWSPVKNINYLTEYAVSKPLEGKQEGSPTYIFFENRNGLNFISLESLFFYQRDKPKRTFKDNDYSRDAYKSGDTVFSKLDIEKAYDKVITLNILNSFDYVERSRAGAYSSMLITYDLTTRAYSEEEYLFEDEYDKETRLNKFPPISSKAVHTKENSYITLTKATALFNGEENGVANWDITNSKTIQRRTSMLKLLDSQRVEIEILGRTDYTVGQVIKMELYKVSDLELETNINDDLLSGNYLITAIRHIITTDKHTCIMELCKDSMVTDLNGPTK
jgi:hypothetical protein